MHKHGHAPRIRLKDGQHTLWVHFHRGYVHLAHSAQRGDFYITRNAWIRLLRQSIKFAPQMDQQFDILTSVKKYSDAEKLWLKEFRQQKRERRRPQPRT